MMLSRSMNNTMSQGGDQPPCEAQQSLLINALKFMPTVPSGNR
jgi:hypothetical protein